MRTILIWARARLSTTLREIFEMWNGEYCTLAAEIDAALNTTHHLKVGETINELTDRADKQRLKMVWGHSKRAGDNTEDRIPCEKELHTIARKMFGAARVSYRGAGHTEMFGNFASAREANNAAWDLLDAVKANPRFSGDEFWVHPQAVARSWYRKLRAA